MALQVKARRCLLGELLEQYNISQTELSSKTDIRMSQLSDYIHNRKPQMSMKTAKKICYVIGCSMNELYEYDVWYE